MRTKIGVITSAKMTGTITVTVHRQKMHPKYQKSYRVSKKFLADSHGFDVAEGDRVVIEECRPISKRKRFKLIEVLQRAARVSALADDAGVESGGRHPKNLKEHDASPSA